VRLAFRLCDLCALYLRYNAPFTLGHRFCPKSLTINDELILVSLLTKKVIPKSLIINTVADVTTLLRILLRVKSLSTNDVADVAGFRRTCTFHHFPLFEVPPPSGRQAALGANSPGPAGRAVTLRTCGPDCTGHRVNAELQTLHRAPRKRGTPNFAGRAAGELNRLAI